MRRLDEFAVIAPLEAHEVLFDDLDILGELKKSLKHLCFRGGILERGRERVHFGDGSGEHVALHSHLVDGFGSVHG